MTVLDEEHLRRVLEWDALIDAMAEALHDLSTGRVQQPVRQTLTVAEHEGFFGVMPAVWGEWMGAKLVTFYPRNAGRGLPTHMAMIQLFRASTGEPVALLDGRLITEMRTAAVSAVALRTVGARGRVLALLGSGVQARAHAAALRRVCPFDEVRVWSPNVEHARRLAEEIGATATPSAETAVRGADAVVTATSAREPVLRGAWLKPGAFIAAVGAVQPNWRELDDEAMLGGSLVVDSRQAALQESGDVILSGAPIHAEIGELLAGSRPVPEGATIFKSVGLAVEDLAAAVLAWRASRRE